MHQISKSSPSMGLRTLGVAGLALCLVSTTSAAMAQPGLGGGGGYTEQTGEAIYKGVCQGCHMQNAQGAVGAGAYPALVGDKRLAAKLYPVVVVVRGQKAMPAFGSSFSDVQIANVVNYIRSHFGDSYTDTVTPEEVKSLRSSAK